MTLWNFLRSPAMNHRPFALLPRLAPLALLLVAGSVLSCGSTASPIGIEEFDSVASSGTACSPSVTITQGALFTGSADCCNYVTGLKVENDLAALVDQIPSGSVALRIDQHEVILETVTSSFKFATKGGGSVKLKDQSSPIVAVLKSSGASTTLLAEVLNSDNGQLLAGLDGTLTITVIVSGHTRDGTKVASAPLSLPVLVSSGASPSCTTGTKKGCTNNQLDGFVCST
jgi:hypothetical protein